MIHAPAPIAAAEAYDFSEIEAYWRDPSAIDAETTARRADSLAELNRAIEASPWRQAQLARWAAEDAA